MAWKPISDKTGIVDCEHGIWIHTFTGRVYCVERHSIFFDDEIMQDAFATHWQPVVPPAPPSEGDE